MNRSGWWVGVAGGVLLSIAAPAAAATLATVQTWGGPESEAVEGTAVASDGSVYQAGTTFSFGTGNGDVFLLKYDADGTLAWQRTWGQADAFVGATAGDVAVAPDGSVYVTGTSFGEVFLLKWSAAGELQWQVALGGSGFQEGNAVLVGGDGGIYVAGTRDSQGPTGRDVFLARFAADGTLVWQKSWDRGQSDNAQALALGPDGVIHVGGTSFREGEIFTFDAVLLRFDPAGTLLSETAWAAGEIADVEAVAAGRDRSVYLAGALDGAADAFIVKLAPDLSLEWQRTWGGRSGERAQALTVGPDGSVWVTGATNTPDDSDELFLLRVSPAGRVLEAHLWGGVEIENGRDLAFAPDGSLYVGAVAQAPPWAFQDGRRHASRVKGALVPVAGTVADAGAAVTELTGVVTEPVGSETYAGGSDAGLLKVLP